MKIKKNYSFSKYIIIQFAIYTLIILGVALLTYLSINWRLNNSFLVLDDFLLYKEKLEYEDYDGIPMSKFPGCDFAIYDENNELIFTTDGDVNDIVEGDDLEFVNDYSGTYYYNIFNYKEKNREKIYKIYKTTYDAEIDEEIVIGNAKLNEDLEIVEGNLFNEKNSLTERELNLLNGYYNDEQMVEKYEYVTSGNGLKRTLLFMSPTFTAESYDSAVSDSSNVWFISISILIIIIIIETYIFNRRVKKILKELNKVISSYENEEIIVNDTNLPKEFDEVAESFENLMEKLKKSNAEKIKIYEDKQKSIANLSHDLKTPLTVISGYSKAFLDDLVPDNKKRQYMESINKKACVATDAIDSLFLYTHMNNSEYNLCREKIDIVTFTKEYLAEKYNEIESAGMHLEVDIEENKILFDADKNAFRRIYENIINNSIKYNKKGTKIYFKMWKDKTLNIVIGDDGIGIDKEIKDKLFEPFVTSNKARTSGDGTGLGLAIVKNFVELHDGEIVLVSKTHRKMKAEFLMKFKI